MVTKKSKKQSDLINLLLGLLIVVIVNVLSQYAFTRVDLTAEKKYTLTPSTKEMLGKLDDIIYFKIYLEGEFPQGAGDFKRLRDETKIMLDEFRAYAGDNIQYEFVDPNENADPKGRKDFHDQLRTKGILKQSITFTDDNGTDVQVDLFPWATASYHMNEVPVPLMGTNNLKPNEIQLNHAVEGLEYELSNAVRKLQMKFRPKIAITQGHGEHDTLQIGDLVKSLREYYQVDYVDFNGNLNAFRDTMQQANQIANKYNAIIVASPDSSYTPNELFILDQFIIYGGKALFLVDPVNTNMDSLAVTGMTIGLPRTLGLEELTFRYGARMNSTIVDDLNCANLALPAPGQQNQFMAVPWYFSPTILPRETHPIVKNLDRIKFDFLSTVDTVSTTANIKKTILLRASDKSRFLRTPTRIALQMAMLPRNPRDFNKPNEPVAVLLEGTFESYYKNKFLPDTIKNSPLIGFKERYRESKVIVVGDGDVAANLVYKGQVLPLGMDRLNRMNRELYANKTFLLNCVNYLLDDKGLLSVRSRDVTLRLLERTKIKEHRLKWQLINTLGPVAYMIFIGLLSFWLRRRTYAQGEPVSPMVRMVIWILILSAPVFILYMIAPVKTAFFLKAGIVIVLGLLIRFRHLLIGQFKKEKQQQ
ncbi:MAG: gliding motility-associated ABC transporter substrate-binding protein GldG [Bacteroidota bacterium]|nr:gliding motility-associated ABC transporter substrate-binding protein GldG [Bacteroidota bacterium]